MKMKEGVVVIKKISNILTGWGKSLGILQVSSAEHKLAALRMERCCHCAYSKESKILRILKDQASHDAVLQCTKCSCPCEEKALVVDEFCPVGKW